MEESTILNLKNPGDLFKGDAEAIRKAYRELVKIWHPDRCKSPKAAEVFAKITQLKDQALAGQGNARLQHSKTFTPVSGSAFSMRFLKEGLTDVGPIFIGANSLSYQYDADLADIAEDEVARIKGFRFADDKMREQMENFLPRLDRVIKLMGGGQLNVQQRGRREVRLVDLIAANGPVAPEHAAWIGSGLLNIAAYLSWAGIVHGAINTETILVDPDTHAVRLSGGWGFASNVGERPKLLPNKTLDVVPAMAVPGQVAQFSLDLEMIRQAVSESLGAPRRSQLAGTSAPAPMRSWLLAAPGKDGFEEYSSWMEMLTLAWGKRRFVKYDAEINGIYGA